MLHWQESPTVWLGRLSPEEDGAWIGLQGRDRVSRTSKEERLQNTHEKN